MRPVAINPKNKEELKFISDLLNKLGIDSKVLTEEEIEDFGMSALMHQADRSKKVSKSAILKKLK